MDLKQTLRERGERYGRFSDQAAVCQDLKEAMRLYDPSVRAKLRPAQAEALSMVAHKIARIINGDPDCHDSWHDIAGYCQLVADEIDHYKRKQMMDEV